MDARDINLDFSIYAIYDGRVDYNPRDQTLK